MTKVEQTVRRSIFVAFSFFSFLQDKRKEGYIKDIKATIQQFSDFLGERKFLAGEKVLYKLLCRPILNWDILTSQNDCYFCLRYPTHRVWTTGVPNRHAQVDKYVCQFRFFGKLPTYPSPKLALTLAFHFGQNDGVGEG